MTLFLKGWQYFLCNHPVKYIIAFQHHCRHYCTWLYCVWLPKPIPIATCQSILKDSFHIYREPHKLRPPVPSIKGILGFVFCARAGGTSSDLNPFRLKKFLKSSFQISLHPFSFALVLTVSIKSKVVKLEFRVGLTIIILNNLSRISTLLFQLHWSLLWNLWRWGIFLWSRMEWKKPQWWSTIPSIKEIVVYIFHQWQYLLLQFLVISGKDPMAQKYQTFTKKGWLIIFWTGIVC